MEKNKHWHYGLVFTVLAVTLYNILPTLFFYCKPLKAPIDLKEGKKIEQQIANRVHSVDEETLSWVKSFCTTLGLKPKSIQKDPLNPSLILVQFNSESDSEQFKNLFFRANHSILHSYRQLNIIFSEKIDPKMVVLTQKIGISEDLKKFTNFTVISENGSFSDQFKTDQLKKLEKVVQHLTSNTYSGLVKKISESNNSEMKLDFANAISDRLNSVVTALSNHPTALKRALASFTQGDFDNKNVIIKATLDSIEELREKVKFEKVKLLEEEKTSQVEGKEFSVAKKEQINFLKNKEESLLQSIQAIKKNTSLLASGKKSPPSATLESIIHALNPNEHGFSKASLQGLNPYIESLSYDWNSGKLELNLYSDLDNNLNKSDFSQLEQVIIDEISTLSLMIGKEIIPSSNQYLVQYHQVESPKGLISIDLKTLAIAAIETVKKTVLEFFTPVSDKFLSNETLSFITGHSFEDLNQGSLYASIKNGMKFIQDLSAKDSSEPDPVYFQDLNSIQTLLRSLGFTPVYQHTSTAFSKDDLVFELRNFYSAIIDSTQEQFSLSSDKAVAELQVSDLKHRIHVLNKIETEAHNELIKWKNDYFSSINHPYREHQPIIVKPTKSTLISNIILSFKKYFRGDERKILKWGLDLSGGKTVEVALVDHENKPVKDEKDIKIGINELYSRVNKLGVSEVSIRQEGDHITLDFPGSQDLSAKDLIQASSMTFHVVNEKFSPQNMLLAAHVDRFLQEIWNQALISGNRDIEHLNTIAKDLLYGDGKGSSNAQPRTESAKILFESGLRLDKEPIQMPAIDLSTCKVIPYKIDSKLQNSTMHHPLLIVFADPALEGSNLSNILSGFDPKEGNFLNFEVKKKSVSRSGTELYPQDILSNWTEKFSKDQLKGSEYEHYSRGNGYRMAVVLNGQIVSAPTLNAAIKEGGRISGQFTQAEVFKLESELKAGSMTFTPKILSEKNVSPELGDQERFYGILATALALSLVILTMIGYYRFAGFIASIAVVFNLLIMWAVLQNIQATITLAGLAGVVLTVGMAVDANVLVFERIKEELLIHKKLSIALENGYKKAFSAIIDSNLTTILAALVLLNFDSGPVKGFAVTLIIGVASSMFTALFMTRLFFRMWLENRSKPHLTMMSWIKSENLNFIKYFKPAFAIVTAIILLGSYYGFKDNKALLGMDFTGGYAVNLSLEPHVQDGKSQVEKAFLKSGFTNQEFSVRELTPKNIVRVFISKNSDVKITELYELMKSNGVPLKSQAISEMEKSWTQVSGQMSETMRNQALIGIAIALLGILFYISVRFEFKFALASTIGLGVDILVTLGIVAILNAFHIPLQIDLNMIAALLTIVGYSLNDTIIVFDRIREETQLNPHLSFSEICNRSLNTTLSRTLLTSGTTLLVLISLVILGGSSIFSFSFVMALGVFIGTLSTFYVATPLLLYFEKKDRKEKTFRSTMA